MFVAEEKGEEVLILVLVGDTLGEQKDYILDNHLFKRAILQYLTF